MSRRHQRPLLSIITVTWNHADEIGEFLDAVKETMNAVPFDIETIIVDNDSSDNTVAIIANQYPWVRLLRNDHNAGFAVACNWGMEQSHGLYMLMLNPDARSKPKAIVAMLKELKKTANNGMTGCTLLHDDGLPQQSAFDPMSFISYWKNHSFLYPLLEKTRKFLWKLGITKSKKPRRVGWMQGSCMMIPRRLYREVGGFEPAYFIYGEDIDWCHRIRDAGYNIIFLPNVAIPHRQSSSAARKPEWCFRKTYHSLALFAKRNLKGGHRDSVYAAMLWDMRLRLPIYTLLKALRPGQRHRYEQRLESVRLLIPIIKKQQPELFTDPPPGRD